MRGSPPTPVGARAPNWPPTWPPAPPPTTEGLMDGRASQQPCVTDGTGAKSRRPRTGPNEGASGHAPRGRPTASRTGWGDAHTRVHTPVRARHPRRSSLPGGACRAGAARAWEPRRCPDRQGPRLQDKPHHLGRQLPNHMDGVCGQCNPNKNRAPTSTTAWGSHQPTPRHRSRATRARGRPGAAHPRPSSAVRACGRHTGRWPSGAPTRAATRLSPPSPAALAGDGSEPRGRHRGTAGPKAGREGRGPESGPLTEQATPHTLGVSGVPTPQARPLPTCKQLVPCGGGGRADSCSPSGIWESTGNSCYKLTRK